METAPMKNLDRYRLVYGGVLCCISVYLVEELSLENTIYMGLLSGLTVCRILVNNEQLAQSAGHPWFSSFTLAHIPFSVSLSLLVSIGLFYQDFDIGFLAGVCVILVVNLMYSIILYRDLGTPFTVPVVMMIGLDLVLELLPILGPPRIIPGVIIEEIVQILFYIVAKAYLSTDVITTLQSTSPKNYLLYFIICSADLLIESFRSSSTLMLVCSYISEALVFWACYYTQIYSITAKKLDDNLYTTRDSGSFNVNK